MIEMPTEHCSKRWQMPT